MILAAVDIPMWTRRRWWLLLALVFGMQVGLIFWLSDHSPPRQRAPARAPGIFLAGNASSDRFALDDPTLFALPHREGFSGPAWLNTAPQKSPSFDWSEAPRWLPLSLEQLGAAL